MVTLNSQRRLRTIAMATAMLVLLAPALSAKDQLKLDQAQAPPPAQPARSGNTLPLSMEQAVALGLEWNLGLKAERLEIDIAAEGIAGARAAFKPLLQSSFGRTSSVTVPGSFTQGSSDISSRRVKRPSTRPMPM